MTMALDISSGGSYPQEDSALQYKENFFSLAEVSDDEFLFKTLKLCF